MLKTHNGVQKVQVETIVGCSDARDIGQLFNGARKKMLGRYLADGILVDTPRLSVPGVFATPEVISEIKTLIFDKQREYYAYSQNGVPVEIFLHMMAHGNAVLKEGHTHEKFGSHDIEIRPSAFNCGMMHAHELAVEFEAMLLKVKPSLSYGINEKMNRVAIKEEEHIEKLMQAAYGHYGTIGGNWVKSIQDLATHPYEQKKILRHAIDSDPALKSLRVHITAGVQNYETNDYFRVDHNIHLPPTFLGDVYEEIRNSGVSDDHHHRVSKQAPKFLLFHPSAVQNARATAVKLFYGSDSYSAGSVFAIGGANVADYFRRFGPYKTMGFYYAGNPCHLNLNTWVVMGRDKNEASMMESRLKNDPLVGFMLKHFNIKLEKIAVDAQQFFQQANSGFRQERAKRAQGR